MGSIGFSEIMVVLVIALVILGPDRLPDAARTVGKWYGQFKRMTGDLQGEVQGVVDEVVQPFNAAIQEGLDSGTETATSSQAETNEVGAGAKASTSEPEPEPVRDPPMLATPGAAAHSPLATAGGALAGLLASQPGRPWGHSQDGQHGQGGLPSSPDDVWAGLGGRPADVSQTQSAASTGTEPACNNSEGAALDYDPSLN